MTIPTGCCCDPPPGPTFIFRTTACSKCGSGMYPCWQVAVAGLTNRTCLGCADWNGTWTLKHMETFGLSDATCATLFGLGTPEQHCMFLTVEDNSGSDSTCRAFGTAYCPRWAMWFDTTSSKWVLLASMRDTVAGDGISGGIRYECAEADFDCSGPSVFTKTETPSNLAACNVDAVSTLTVEPITCP